MKKNLLLYLIIICFCNCSQVKKTIDFVSLDNKEFNSELFAMPDVRAVDSIKHSHDSCMGFSFDANAILFKTKDSIFIGSIVNRQSLKIVNTVGDLGLTQTKLTSAVNFLSNPCYEKHALQLPLKLILGENFTLQLPGADDAMNKELNDAISASKDAEIQTGSWVYLDLKDALKNILDTTKSVTGLAYKKNLLDPVNMILTTVESITDVSFIISTQKDISDRLQTLLIQKPFATLQNSAVTIRLIYLDNKSFQISINGFFPVAGQFMKAELK